VRERKKVSEFQYQIGFLILTDVHLSMKRKDPKGKEKKTKREREKIATIYVRNKTMIAFNHLEIKKKQVLMQFS